MRKITIISNGVAKAYETEVTNWGQLKELIFEDFPTVDSMNGAVRGSNVTLVVNEAELPKEDCYVFLLPVKNKSGIDTSEWTREECYAFIKKVNLTEARGIFGVYSSKSTDTLREEIACYISETEDSFSIEDVALMLKAIYKIEVTTEQLVEDMDNFMAAKEVILEECAVRESYGIDC